MSVTAVLEAKHISNPTHRVKGLKWAELRDTGPYGKSRPKKRAYKNGIAYERVVGRHLKRMIADEELDGELFLSQWILFCDKSGVHWAQPDAFILMGARILLIECKLTQSDSATPQLLSLYLPLLRKIYSLPIICLQTCKNLRYVPKKIVDGPVELLNEPGPGVFVWHFLGD